MLIMKVARVHGCWKEECLKSQVKRKAQAKPAWPAAGVLSDEAKRVCAMVGYARARVDILMMLILYF
jgi:hypothetical protein